MAYSCCITWRGNLDFLLKKFYNIDYCKRHLGIWLVEESRLCPFSSLNSREPAWPLHLTLHYDVNCRPNDDPHNDVTTHWSFAYFSIGWLARRRRCRRHLKVMFWLKVCQTHDPDNYNINVAKWPNDLEPKGRQGKKVSWHNWQIYQLRMSNLNVIMLCVSNHSS